jgi:hypothetical protein
METNSSSTGLANDREMLFSEELITGLRSAYDDYEVAITFLADALADWIVNEYIMSNLPALLEDAHETVSLKRKKINLSYQEFLPKPIGRKRRR